MDVVQSPPSSSSQLPFYGTTSSFNATADVLMTSEIASFHFRHLAASICLARGFASVEAGALAELEKETERYLGGLLQATLANAHAGPARRRPTIADALESMMGEVPVGEARENVVKDWKKAIGKEVRRNRTGKVADHPSLKRRNLTPSPPKPRMITLSDDEFDLPHLNIPFRAPAGVDVKGKVLPVVPQSEDPTTPGMPMSSALSTPGPSTSAGFKLKLKMAARPGPPSPTTGTSIPTAEPSTPSHAPKRRTEELKHFPRKKSKEKRKAERQFLEETKKVMPDWGLKGVLPGLPARHTWVTTELKQEKDVPRVDPRVEDMVALEDEPSVPRTRPKPGSRARNAREPSPVIQQPELLTSSLFPVSQPATDSKLQRPNSQSSSTALMPPLTGKLQSTSLEFLQSTLRDRADIRHDVGLINYRKVGGLLSRNEKGTLGGVGASRKTGVRWKIRGLKG